MIAPREIARRALARLRRASAALRRHRRRLVATGCAALVVLAALLAALAFSRSSLDDPGPSLLLRDARGRFLAVTGESGDAELGYWPLDELPPRVAAAALAAEDRRFANHPGVDALAAARAVRQALAAGHVVSGASTIAMQVARLQDPGSRNLPRKIVEAATALALTARHGREDVLRQYLRLAPYGNRARGIGFAARRYFDKPVEDLSWAETVFLTAIPQSPSRMNPWTDAGRRAAITRGRAILDELAREGALSPAEHALAARQLVALRIPAPRRRPESAIHAILYLEEKLADPSLRARYRSHPIVDTTLDLDLQEEVAWIALSARDEWRSEGAGNAAVIVSDARTNAVLAWVGSTGYFENDAAGAIDFARTPRSPGSLLKPFVYALALDRRAITPATILDDLPRGPDGLTNSDGLGLGPLLPRVALANSRNVPAAEVLRRVGLDDAYTFLGALGLHDGSHPAREYGLGLSIGAMPVTLESVVAASSVLAGEGEFRELRWLRSGQPPPPRQLLSESTAREVTLFLSDAQARLPSFPRLGATELPFPVAVKTGTSSRHRDAWALGWSRTHVVGAWIGHPDALPMKDLTGHRSAARLVHRVLMDLAGPERDGLEDVSFPAPRDAVRLRLCALSGMLATSACDRVVDEWLGPGDAPTLPCSWHARIPIDTRSGAPATSRTPRAFTELRTFVHLPARLASWGAGSKLPVVSDSFPVSGKVSDTISSVSDTISTVAVTSPRDGLRLARDPETPPDLATVALEVQVDPPVSRVTWYVDGAPFAVAAHPYGARWKLAPGEHSFQARLPGGAASRIVRVLVD